MCKLADIHHRLSRAVIHDNAQISQWLTFEQERVLTSELNVRNRSQQYHILQNKIVSNKEEKGSAEIENRIVIANENGNGNENETENQHNLSLTLQNNSPSILESMSKLQREMTIRSQKLLAAEEKEEAARKVSQDRKSVV